LVTAALPSQLRWNDGEPCHVGVLAAGAKTGWIAAFPDDLGEARRPAGW
jgi:hypothetical protein